MEDRGTRKGEVVARRIRTWAEQDAYSPWRKVLCWTQRAGARKGVKKMTHRWERRVQARKDIEERMDE